MIFPVFQFDPISFVLSFFIMEIISSKYPKLRLFVFNGKRKIKIHHAYLGALLAFFASMTGEIGLMSVGLGAFFSDAFFHIKKFFKRNKG